MQTVLEPEKLVTFEETLCHYYCIVCYPKDDRVIAYCGTDVTFEEETPNSDAVDCTVCVTIEYCPICDPPEGEEE